MNWLSSSIKGANQNDHGLTYNVPKLVIGATYVDREGLPKTIAETTQDYQRFSRGATQGDYEAT